MAIKRIKRLLAICGIVIGVYLTSFFIYRHWAYSTEGDRPDYGSPAWYFVYPTRNVFERTVYWLFYPCIRIDWKIHDARELG